MTALNGDLVDNDNNGEDSPTIAESTTETEEEAVDVNNGIGTKSTNVKKVSIHESAAVNILIKGRDKMKSKNLPAVRYRKKCRMQREQIALRDTIYKNMINTNDKNLFNRTIVELKQIEDGNIFGTWDKEIRSLI